jgi:hypothetical protein
MTTTLNAVTYDGGVTLTLLDGDAAELHALPPLPKPEHEDFEAPSVIVTDVVSGRTLLVSRFGLTVGHCQCGCAAYAEDITESWKAFVAQEAAGR